MKKKKKNTVTENNLSDVVLGSEIVIIAELLDGFKNDFEFEEKSTFHEGGIEFKIVKILSYKSNSSENNQDENDDS